MDIDKSEDLLWSFHVIDSYKELEGSVGWNLCPVCKVTPRIWIFNNGRVAKCLCSNLYGEPQARAESILSVVHRSGGSSQDYDYDDLRKAWNKYTETGKRQLELEEGRW